MDTGSTSSATHSRSSSHQDQDHRPVPLALNDSSNLVIRRGPSSPVMVSFEKEGTYQAFNANIENARPDSEHSLHAQKVAQPQDLAQSQDLPQSQDLAQSQDLPQSPTVVIHPTGDESATQARQSGESDGMSAKGTSAESSVATSASSISGTANSDGADGDGLAGDGSAGEEPCEPVQTFQYHHAPRYPPRVASAGGQRSDGRSGSQTDLLDAAMNNRLTPNPAQRSTIARPHSTASLQSDFGGSRGRSPGHPRRSPEVRPTSYAELLNVPYPQPAPAPMMPDNSGLRNAVGENASLLSTQKTLEMYRVNVKKTASVEVQYAFAVFLISTAQEQGIDFDEAKPDKKRTKSGSGSDNDSGTSSLELLKEARNILQKLASNGYPFAQYYLADGYASGILNKGKEDYGQAFPLFVLAAKHGHAESAYRTALCYEFGAGCRKDPARAVQFLRSAASKGHPGAMTRLGQACLFGDLGEKRYREGVKWVKLATEAADVMYSTAPYQLGCMYETGYGDDIFQDESYAATLFTQAAELGNADASYRMGEAYESGKLNCPKDPALSVHYYNGAAERGHAGAMMGLCAWYMVGAPPFLEKDEAEAYAWARKAAELGLVKAQYAIGYFTESGIGCHRDALEANLWYVKAADAGNEHAQRRLAIIRAAATGGTPMEVAPARSTNKIKKAEKVDKADKGEDSGGQCIVM